MMQKLIRKRLFVPAALATAAVAVALTTAPASAAANTVVVNSRLYPAGTGAVDIESTRPNGGLALSNCANVDAGQNATVNVWVRDGASVRVNFYSNRGCSGFISARSHRAPNPVANVWNIN